jgi:hypothetical protein
MLPLRGSCRGATEGVFRGHRSSTSGFRWRVGGEARSGPGRARMTVGSVFAFRLDLTAPRNRLSRGTTTEGLFHPDRRSPSDGQDQVARKGPSATPTDPGTGRFELSGPVDPSRPLIVRPGPWILLRPATQDSPTARRPGPARFHPHRLLGPVPRALPRDGDSHDCAGGSRTGALVTLIFLQDAGKVHVPSGASGDRGGWIPAKAHPFPAGRGL